MAKNDILTPINAHQKTGSYLVAMLGVVLGVGCKLLLPENPPPPTGVLVNREERPVCLGVANILSFPATCLTFDPYIHTHAQIYEVMATRKIYFAGSIRAGRNDAQLYAKIVAILKTFGTVLTEHVGDPNMTEAGLLMATLYLIIASHTTLCRRWGSYW